MAVARQLRYSPRNFLIVDWSNGGRPFSECGLPSPIPCLTGGAGCGDACDHPLPITEALTTYDWERWLPEVIVGIDDPDEEIAANYVRQAAIEFCKGARVLQREIVIELQADTTTYPVFPYPEEQIVGVIGVRMTDDDCGVCSGRDLLSGAWRGSQWRLDTARNAFSIDNAPSNGVLRLLVWSAPTEGACVHDSFLYDRFRADITMGARLQYAAAVHFRDRALMASLPSYDMFARAMLLAKTKALMLPNAWQARAGTTFSVGRGQTREDQFFRRG
jgi:hypothetical protein